MSSKFVERKIDISKFFIFKKSAQNLTQCGGTSKDSIASKPLQVRNFDMPHYYGTNQYVQVILSKQILIVRFLFSYKTMTFPSGKIAIVIETP